MNNIVAYSEKNDAEEALYEVKAQIDAKGKPSLIIFSSDSERFSFYAEEIKKAYPHAKSIGSSGKMTYTSKGFSENAFSVIAIYDGIEASTGALFEITHYPMRYSSSIEKALCELSDLENTVCIAFNTAYGNCEELVQDTFKKVLGERNIPVVGGTAGAKFITEKTFVALNGLVYDEATVFVIVKNLCGRIYVYKENIFRPTRHFVTATDVDCENRIVYEYDGKPAAEALMEHLDSKDEHMEKVLLQHPMGRIVGNEMYIITPGLINKDGSMLYFARIYNRTKLMILEPDDVDFVWKKTRENVKSVIENPSLTFSVNCYARMRYFEDIGKNGDFNDFLSDGFGNHMCMTGFGEQFNFEHFNQTMVMVVFE